MKTEVKERTGRTTRMLQEARKLAEGGFAVYVICQNPDELKEIFGEPRLGVKFERWVSSLDPETLRLRGSFPATRVLIDHYTLETRFAAILKELHRYDAESGK